MYTANPSETVLIVLNVKLKICIEFKFAKFAKFKDFVVCEMVFLATADTIKFGNVGF